MLALAAHIPPAPCKTSSIFGPFFLGLLLLACDLALLHQAYLSSDTGRAPREFLDKDMRSRAFIRAGWKHERFAQVRMLISSWYEMSRTVDSSPFPRILLG
jgi:hypothetical protein